jgi:hypothetical protein
VLDTTWTPLPGDDTLGLREVAAEVLARRDTIAETSALLDAWAEASQIAQVMTSGGTSFWYHDRLRTWTWLQEQVIWLALVGELVRRTGPGRLECGEGAGSDVAAAVRRIGVRDDLGLREQLADSSVAARSQAPEETEPDAAADRPARRSLMRRVRDRVVLGWYRPWSLARRARRLGRGSQHPLVALMGHAPQVVETPAGPRRMNAYLGPVLERLEGTELAPVLIERRAYLRDDADWAALAAPGSGRRLPADLARWYDKDTDAAEIRQETATVLAGITAIRAPLVVEGVDLGPELVAQILGHAKTAIPGQLRSVRRLTRLFADLQPAGVLVADEYHRQDWLAAAAAVGVRSAAVQHGLIYAHHTGYMHQTRPASLRLPDRTYVFGDWERALLTGDSVYRPDEVVTGGSPRLDYVSPNDASPVAVDRDAVRRKLGVAPGDKMVVVSGTWGPVYRRFHYPICLDRILDRPMIGIHLVIKLHPSERDEGPYRAVIEGVAAARGFAPPPLSIVQDIDLYRLLSAADAHLGVHSTVLTEAVAAGTLNLLAATLAGPDLLGYLEAGVAVPVRNGEDVARALAERDVRIPTPEAKEEFLAAHFEPGRAAERIAADLLAWLA